MRMHHNSKTTLNVVIGHPLDHTQSPLLHQIAYEYLGLNAVLLAFPTTDLACMMNAIRTLAVELVAVTMPWKEKILDYADVLSDEVKSLRCANTLIRQGEQYYAYNTDVYGVEFALRNIVLQQRKILILGAGGAARAAAFVMQKNQGVLYFYNRTTEKAAQLAEQFNGQVLTLAESMVANMDVIINATPLGMTPHIYSTPFQINCFNPQQVVFDMIYHPPETQLLQRAKSNGAQIISGLDMFVAQGLQQIQLWKNYIITSDTFIEKIKIPLRKRIENASLHCEITEQKTNSLPHLH